MFDVCVCFVLGKFLSELILWCVGDLWFDDLVKLVNWCFEPSQSLGIISGLKETFIKRHMVERANKAAIRLEKQCENGEFWGVFMK